MEITHKFVEFIPETLEDGILYISIEYCTAVHKCMCGCGKEVVTPLSPTDWEIRFNGKTVSLNPSIGNWSFECKSHYWITKNKIYWAEKWSKKKIRANRKSDKQEKGKYYNEIFDSNESKKTYEKKSLIKRIGFWNRKKRNNK